MTTRLDRLENQIKYLMIHTHHVSYKAGEVYPIHKTTPPITEDLYTFCPHCQSTDVKPHYKDIPGCYYRCLDCETIFIPTFYNKPNQENPPIEGDAYSRCPNCGSMDTIPVTVLDKPGNYRCNKCGKTFIPELIKKEKGE